MNVASIFDISVIVKTLRFDIPTGSILIKGLKIFCFKVIVDPKIF